MYQGSVTQELMTKIAISFREHRLDDVVNHFTDDGVFVNGKGPDVEGNTYRGKKELREFFASLFDATPDVRWDRVQPDWICGDRAVTQWHRKATSRDGQYQEWLGCDLYEFEGTLIRKKNTFIKIIL